MQTVAQLGYVAFEVSDLEVWRNFGQNVLGLDVTDVTDVEGGGLAMRMDGRVARFYLSEGPLDDLAAAGWQLPDDAALDALVADLRAQGHDVTEGDAALAKARGVDRLFKCLDPDDNPLELSTGTTAGDTPFESELVPSGFAADELGLGHLVLSSKDADRSAAFYTQLLGFKLSDRIRCEIHGFPVDVKFYHCNGRHHSLALGGPMPKRVHHFMIEVKELDEVGRALDRHVGAGLRVAQTIGRHPNDRMVSFYGLTPSGFQFEFGWGGRVIDDATWETTEYDQVSEWGHMPPQLLAPRRKKEPANG